ncbi:serine hydrolase [Pedobacter foliorum]|uniref:serine hydrolase domain-containing protein n=1 Tax=Pedobacter foliorum TaxID=2739058 RepID=UPI001563B96C|nr:serine hydrolase domain-containing protein [Pedobacter foliorum]NRF38868.1 beta-lactamase family protein [Pedobacter foliorum]
MITKKLIPKRIAIIILVIVIFGTTTDAQKLSDSTIVRVDRLFEKWNKNDIPGCVVGIVRGNDLVYAKGFGLANLENETANTSQTIFYMCSVSKQFAGYAIALLARGGKLQLDDKIQDYLPWMHDFGKKITIRNLLNHTSGIRDDIGLSQYFGLNLDGMLTQDLAIQILKRQRTLNFIPGEKFSYSNSNYVLLAEIVKEVSKKSFRDYVDSIIFKPLGMSSSKFVDDYSEVIKNRAVSYRNNNGVFYNSSQNVYTLGDGGLFTNVNDMAKWVTNFYAPMAGDLQDIEMLTTQGKLNNGKTINYAMGVSVDSYRGQKRFMHNGGLAGYRTIIAVYPDLKMGFVVFGNGGDAEIYKKIDELSALFIPTNIVPPQGVVEAAVQTIVLKDSMFVNRWVGTYLAANGYKVSIASKGGELVVNGNSALAPESTNLFHIIARPSVKYQFSTDLKTKKTQALLITPALSKPMELSRVAERPLSAVELGAYVGSYYSDELDCSFQIKQKGAELWISNKRYNDRKVTLLGSDHLFTDYDFLSHILIRRDAKNKVLGFDLNSGETMGLFFKKERLE